MDQRVQQAARVSEAVKELDIFDAAADHFLLACEERFSKVVGHNSSGVTSESFVTHFVIPGREFTLSDGNHCLTFWVGINGGRIFFITRYIGEPEGLREVFRFSLGGAEKIGWDFYYEKVEHAGEEKSPVSETSIWGTVDTGHKLTAKRATARREGELDNVLTDEGCFWVNDIAMMLQSLLRTSQRHNIINGTTPPAPL